MTKRKHTAKPATALNPTAPVVQTLSPNSLHLDTSANPSAEKKAKLSRNLNKTVVSGHTAGEGLDIDDIFEQARHKKHVPVKTQQGSKAVSKTPRVAGSKDDLFGTGQPKLRRYDAEGLPVYTPEELKVGAGGETDKCPFDCDCCY